MKNKKRSNEIKALEEQLAKQASLINKQSVTIQSQMDLLQIKYEIRIPAQIEIAGHTFPVVLVDKDNKPIEKKENAQPEKAKTDLYTSLNLSYIG